MQDSTQDDSGDIVVRDRNGKYDVQVPNLQLVTVETQGLEEEIVNEKERLDAMLLERYKDRSLQSGEPEGTLLTFGLFLHHYD